MTSYRIYGSPSPGAPVDYSTPVATTASLTWATPPLTAGVHRFGVRAFDTVSGLEESNVDAAVEVAISAGLADVSAVPAAPRGLAVVARAGGGARVSWSWPAAEPLPTGFRVYLGTPAVSYAGPVATVLATDGTPFVGGQLAGQVRYSATLTGLAEAVAYQVAVRAYNAVGEEANATVVNVIGSAAGPANVVNLAAS